MEGLPPLQLHWHGYRQGDLHLRLHLPPHMGRRLLGLAHVPHTNARLQGETFSLSQLMSECCL